MPPTLSVELNRQSLHDVAVVNAFETTDSFTVELRNEGEAVHVHLHLDDDLSRVARLDAGNHYVERGSTRRVRVDVAPVDDPYTGKLKIVTGYGAETAYVEVTVSPETETKEPVQVDENLAKPPTREPGEETSIVDAVLGASTRSLVGLLLVAAFAVVLAVAVAASVNSAAVVLGVGVVIGVAVAGVIFAMR